MMETLNNFAQKIKIALNDLDACITISHSEIVVDISKENLIETIRRFRDHHQLMLGQLIDITAIDYPSRKERFCLVYFLLSLQHNFRLRLTTNICETETVPTLSNVFFAADWYEREIWDMFGIVFEGHGDLRRILTDYDFEGHPLRKDFPLTGFQEVHYSETEEKVVYGDISLPLMYREYDFLSPWKGLPGDEKANSSEGKNDL